MITLVIYFGKDDWNYGTNLHSCLDISPELLPFVSDYKVNFYSLKDMTEEQIENFKSDFKVIAEFFHALSSGENYHPTNQKLDHPEEVIDMISTFSGDDRFRDEYNSISKQIKEGGISMCEIYDKILQEGEAKGFFFFFLSLVKKGMISLAQAAEQANMTIEEFESKTGLQTQN